MERQRCQSCGMPMRAEKDKGTEANGTSTDKYCINCYKDGKFTWPDATAEQMQIYCMGILTKEKHWPAFLARSATNGIPKLERWQTEPRPVKPA